MIWSTSVRDARERLARAVQRVPDPELRSSMHDLLARLLRCAEGDADSEIERRAHEAADAAKLEMVLDAEVAAVKGSAPAQIRREELALLQAIGALEHITSPESLGRIRRAKNPYNTHAVQAAEAAAESVRRVLFEDEAPAAAAQTEGAPAHG